MFVLAATGLRPPGHLKGAVRRREASVPGAATLLGNRWGTADSQYVTAHIAHTLFIQDKLFYHKSFILLGLRIWFEEYSAKLNYLQFKIHKRCLHTSKYKTGHLDIEQSHRAFPQNPTLNKIPAGLMKLLCCPLRPLERRPQKFTQPQCDLILG